MATIYGANTLSTGYDVANSLRFDNASSDYLNRTQGGAGNRKTWTFSTWIKISKRSGDRGIFSYYDDNNNFGKIGLQGDYNQLVVNSRTSGTYNSLLQTNYMLRDFSSWYNIIVAADTTQGTEANRIKIYINGVQITSFSSSTYPSQNHDLEFNITDANYISNWNGSSQELDGYLAETVFIDGSQLDQTSFGEFDSDSPTIWKPIDVSDLTFGTYGFYLDYEDSSSLGNDVAGSNNFSVNNLTAVSQSTDTCTNNFCVMNHLDNYFAGSTFSNGNLQVNTANSPYTYNTGTMGMTKGKWYFEGKWISAGSGNSAVGIISTVSTATSDEAPNKTDSAMYKDDGVVRRNNGNGTSIAEVSNNNLIMVAYDADNNFAYFGYNGTWGNSGDPTSGASGTGGYDPGNVPASTATGAYFPMFSDHNSGQGFSMSFNFGSPDYSISSGNADANGHGNFEYAVPSGYFALCTKNLAEHG